MINSVSFFISVLFISFQSVPSAFIYLWTISSKFPSTNLIKGESILLHVLFSKHILSKKNTAWWHSPWRTNWITDFLFVHRNILFTHWFFFFFFLSIYLFIYLWLCWVFVSVRGLSLVVASGDHSSSRCAGLSLSWPLLAEHRLQTRRLSNCGSRAQLLRGTWDLPKPGLEPVSPALAGRLSTPAPPGKPHSLILEFHKIYF